MSDDLLLKKIFCRIWRIETAPKVDRRNVTETPWRTSVLSGEGPSSLKNTVFTVFRQTSLSKQCRPRWDAVECGISSESTLFATHPAILKQNIRKVNCVCSNFRTSMLKSWVVQIIRVYTVYPIKKGGKYSPVRVISLRSVKTGTVAQLVELLAHSSR